MIRLPIQKLSVNNIKYTIATYELSKYDMIRGVQCYVSRGEETTGVFVRRKL